MAYTVAQLRQDVEENLKGTTLDKIPNPTDLINRSARDVLADVDFAETKRIAQITNALYDRIYDYVLPNDLKGNKIIDIRPQISRFMGDNFVQHPGKEFDLYKANSSITVQHNTGIKTIRISKNLITGLILDGITALSTNGAWTATAIAQNLAQDLQFFVTGGSSLSFDLNGNGASQTGYLENSTMTVIDFTKHLNISSWFLFVFIPANPANLTNVNLRWGQNATNYWNVSVTSNNISGAFQVGWNILRFNWNGATKVGTPDVTQTKYARITLTWNGAAPVQTNFRVNQLMSILPNIYEIVYYSKFLFSNSAGTFQETTTNDTDTINLDTESYNIFLYKVLENAALQIQQAIPLRGKLINFDYDSFGGLYDQAKKRYKENYHSEALPVTTNYYSNRYRTRR